jgi:hypothetical protein
VNGRFPVDGGPSHVDKIEFLTGSYRGHDYQTGKGFVIPNFDVAAMEIESVIICDPGRLGVMPGQFFESARSQVIVMRNPTDQSVG